MKLIFHIAKKDARRVWPLWLPWLGVAAAKLALAFAVARDRYLVIGTFSAENVSLGLAGLDAALTYLLAAWLMLEDAPMNTRHFGLTRPVGRGTLLAAKLVGALGLLWLPAVAVWSPWWVYCGFTTGDMLAEAGVVLAGTALAVLPAFLVASLVDSFRRVLLWTPVWLGAVAIAFPVPLIWMIQRSFGDSGAGHDLESLGLWQSRFLLGGTVLVGGAMLGFVWQFFRRHPREVVPPLAAIFAATLAILMCAPWNFWPDRGEWAETNPERASGVDVKLAWAREMPSSSQGLDSRLELRWRGNAPAETKLWPVRNSTTLGKGEGGWISPGSYYTPQVPDDDGIVWSLLDFDSVPAGAADAETLANWTARGVRVDSLQTDKSFGWGIYGPGRFFTENGSVRLHARMLLARLDYQVSPMMDLAVGSWSPRPGRKVHVRQMTRDSDAPSVRGLDTRRARLMKRKWIGFFAPLAAEQTNESLDSDGLALADGWNREWWPTLYCDWWNGGEKDIGGAVIRRFKFSASPAWVIREGVGQKGPVTDEWRAGLRLVAVERRETARFYREVTVDPLRIETER